MGNELIISIGRQLNIPGKVDNEWICRVIYSIAGQMGLASLWDYDEGEDTVSIQHFKERIAEIFAAYEETIFYKGIMPSETGFRFSSGL